MTIDQIIGQLAEFSRFFWSGVLWLVDGVRPIVDGVTRDHLEGALVMTVIFLGPSLVVGLLSGFWHGLRIEWQHFRELPDVIDGDTIDIRGERIRLFAVDAPEMGQPWWDEDDQHQDAGRLAREVLATLVKGRKLSVRVLREDQYERSIAIVKVDGRDVGRSLVSLGYAFAAPGSDRYGRTQASAKRRKKGLWRGELQMPWDYRAAA